MNRKYLPPRIQSYTQTIRATARIIEKWKSSWTLEELICKIKSRYAISTFSFEKNVIHALDKLLQNEELEYTIGVRGIKYFRFGFTYETLEEQRKRLDYLFLV